MNRQLRRGLTRLIGLDSARGEVARHGTVHTVVCRVSYERGGVWGYSPVDAGANFNTSPYLLADRAADVQSGDCLHWRDRYFQIGSVSFPTFAGAKVCLQAELREIGEEAWTASVSVSGIQWNTGAF
jgi:hypothetical protein